MQLERTNQDVAWFAPPVEKQRKQDVDKKTSQ
jgi:hypothetical protein